MKEVLFSWHSLSPLIQRGFSARQWDVARNVQNWLEEHDQDFQVLPWPSNTPDLNQSEHLWDHLDHHVRSMDPPPRILQQLWDALQSA